MRKNGFVVMGHLLKLVTPTFAHLWRFTITIGNTRFPGCHLYYGAWGDGFSKFIKL